MTIFPKSSDQSPSSIYMWSLFFAYTLLSIWIVQWFLLPYVFPQWHAGNGLLIGGDWLGTHRVAVGLAQTIREQGWSAWTLRPGESEPAGIAASIYALTVSKPWIAAIVHAAMHATAIFVVFQIARLFVVNRKMAFLCVLPFLLYPSSMVWNATMLKDIYSIPGALMLIYGWILISRKSTWQGSLWKPLRAYCWVYFGMLIIWSVRWYLMKMMIVPTMFLVLMLVGTFIMRYRSNRLRWNVALAAILIVISIPIKMRSLSDADAKPLASVVFVFKKGSQYISYLKNIYFSQIERVKVAVKPPVQLIETIERSVEVPKVKRQEVEFPDLPDGATIMQRISSIAERNMEQVRKIRRGYPQMYPDAYTNIDLKVRLETGWDFLFYIPRAAFVAFMTPFPNQWFSQGSTATTTAMRKVAGLETFGVYLAWFGLPLSLWHWRKRIELWVIIIFGGSMMVFSAYTVPNIGALYRFRYGYWMLWITIAIAGHILFWRNRRISQLRLATANSSS